MSSPTRLQVVLSVLTAVVLISYLVFQIVALSKESAIRLRTFERSLGAMTAHVETLLPTCAEEHKATMQILESNLGGIANALLALERHQREANEAKLGASGAYQGHSSDDSSYAGHGLEFYALTYASHGGSDDYFCRSLRTALHNNVPIRLLGWNSNNVQLVRKAWCLYARL
jgi:hypothetical protein